MNNLRWHKGVTIRNSLQRNHVQMGRASHLPKLCAALLLSQAVVHVVVSCSLPAAEQENAALLDDQLLHLLREINYTII